MGDRCITCYRPLGDDSVPCPCGCGRQVCPNHVAPGEPTATQLYDEVKERRAARGHRVLTIPEIHAVLTARADWVAAGPQATPDQDEP